MIVLCQRRIGVLSVIGLGHMHTQVHLQHGGLEADAQVASGQTGMPGWRNTFFT